MGLGRDLSVITGPCISVATIASSQSNTNSNTANPNANASSAIARALGTSSSNNNNNNYGNSTNSARPPLSGGGYTSSVHATNIPTGAGAAVAPPLPYASVAGLTTHPRRTDPAAAAAAAAATPSALMAPLGPQSLAGGSGSAAVAVAAAVGAGAGAAVSQSRYAGLAENLVLLGYDKAAAVRALEATGGHVGAATAMLAANR